MVEAVEGRVVAGPRGPTGPREGVRTRAPRRRARADAAGGATAARTSLVRWRVEERDGCVGAGRRDVGRRGADAPTRPSSRLAPTANRAPSAPRRAPPAASGARPRARRARRPPRRRPSARPRAPRERVVGRHGVGRGQRGLRLDEGAERTRRVRVAADRRLEERAQHRPPARPGSRAPQAARPGRTARALVSAGAARATARFAGGVPRHTAPRELVRDGRREQHRPRGAAVQRGRLLPALDAPEGHGRADGAGAGVARLVRASCSSSANASSPPMIRSRHARSTFPAASAQAWIGAPCAASWPPCRTMSRHACGACSCSQSWMSRRFAAAMSCSGAFGWWSWAQVSQMARARCSASAMARVAAMACGAVNRSPLAFASSPCFASA